MAEGDRFQALDPVCPDKDGNLAPCCALASACLFLTCERVPGSHDAPRAVSQARAPHAIIKVYYLLKGRVKSAKDRRGENRRERAATVDPEAPRRSSGAESALETLKIRCGRQPIENGVSHVRSSRAQSCVFTLLLPPCLPLTLPWIVLSSEPIFGVCCRISLQKFAGGCCVRRPIEDAVSRVHSSRTQSCVFKLLLPPCLPLTLPGIMIDFSSGLVLG